MLFWSANWMPFTISGISGTMARTVTPMKYWRSKCERTLLQETKQRKRSSEGHVRLRGGWRVLRWVACPDLRDVGLVQQGLDVLRDKISTSRRQCGGHDEDDQRPPPGPVDHGSMVLAHHCGHSESQSHVAASGEAALQSGYFLLLPAFCLFSTVLFQTRALSFADMNVVNMGVRLQGECQADDVGDGQEGRHGVHQRPGESDHREGGSQSGIPGILR